MARGGISVLISPEEIGPISCDEIAPKRASESLWGPPSPLWMRSHLGSPSTQAEVEVGAGVTAGVEAGVTARVEAGVEAEGRWGVKLADDERCSPRSIEREPLSLGSRLEAYPVDVAGDTAGDAAGGAAGGVAAEAAAEAAAGGAAPEKIFRSYEDTLPGVKDACRKIEP